MPIAPRFLALDAAIPGCQDGSVPMKFHLIDSILEQAPERIVVK
jgi:hypothetical protein